MQDTLYVSHQVPAVETEFAIGDRAEHLITFLMAVKNCMVFQEWKYANCYIITILQDKITPGVITEETN